MDHEDPLAQRHERGAVIHEIRGMGQVPRRRPFPAVVADSVAVPDFAGARRQRMVPQQQPDSSRCVHGQARHTFVPLATLRRKPVGHRQPVVEACRQPGTSPGLSGGCRAQSPDSSPGRSCEIAGWRSPCPIARPPLRRRSRPDPGHHKPGSAGPRTSRCRLRSTSSPPCRLTRSRTS